MVLQAHVSASGGFIASQTHACRIQELVAGHFDLRVADILGSTRKRRVVWTRFLAIALVREFTGMGLTDIGFCFGGRDHTTILNALDRAEDLRRTVPDFQRAYEELSRFLETSFPIRHKFAEE